MVRSVDRVGRTCSKPCGSKHLAKLKIGSKQSPETIAKRSAALLAIRTDPERNAKWNDAASKGIKKWHLNPENAKQFAARSSERMRRRHADPEWRKVRDERSSRTLRATWETQRDRLLQASANRYLRDERLGIGICSDQAKQKKALANKWIMKRAQEALHSETNYNELYAEVQAQLRLEMPYDGPQEGSDYMDYLQKLGRAVVGHPVLRELADKFMSEAIPRFAGEWRKKRDRDGSGEADETA